MIKRIIILLTCFVFSASNVFAVEEILLEKENNKRGIEYFSDVYYGKIEENQDVSPILKLFSQDGLKFENSKINSIKLGFFYQGKLDFTKVPNYHTSKVFDVTDFEPKFNMKFNENKSEFNFVINCFRDVENHSNSFTQKISELNFTQILNENQKIIIGQSARLPVTYNGSLSVFDLETVSRSQIGRFFGDDRGMGIRNIGNYKYAQYDIGVYDSTRYMRHFGKGSDFAGSIYFKPLENYSNKTGDLKLGGSFNLGKYYNSYNVFSVFGGYDYKKFHIKAEYANADGYNGVKYSQNKANGFYTFVSYDLTPKISVIGRYDFFDKNKKVSHSNVLEYTSGITYKPYKNLHFLINYTRRCEDKKADSNIFMFATRFNI